MHKSTLGSLAHFISLLAFRRGLPEISTPRRAYGHLFDG
jgi:hypothetical protein